MLIQIFNYWLIFYQVRCKCLSLQHLAGLFQAMIYKTLTLFVNDTHFLPLPYTISPKIQCHIQGASNHKYLDNKLFLCNHKMSSTLFFYVWEKNSLTNLLINMIFQIRFDLFFCNFRIENCQLCSFFKQIRRHVNRRGFASVACVLLKMCYIFLTLISIIPWLS